MLKYSISPKLSRLALGIVAVLLISGTALGKVNAQTNQELQIGVVNRVTQMQQAMVRIAQQIPDNPSGQAQIMQRYQSWEQFKQRVIRGEVDRATMRAFIADYDRQRQAR